MRGEGRTIALVVLDGVADRPARELDGATPLEAAETSNLDRLAAMGATGSMDVHEPGVPLSSDRAHSILFGYSPGEVPARGVLEARGFDIEVPAGAVACSASYARVDSSADGWTITDRKVSAHRDRCEALSERVAVFEREGVTARFRYTWKNRGIVTLTQEAGRPLGADVVDTDPFEAGLPVVRSEPTHEATDPEGSRRSADTLAAYTRWTIEQLSDAPVDVVLTKWVGTPTDPESFAARTGMQGVSLTRKPVLQGLARTLGMDTEPPPDDYAERIPRMLDALERADFVHLHYPEPDEVSHAETPAAKRDEIERIDATLDPLVDRAANDPELVVCVTADHTTPSVGNVVHSGEPVPVVVTGETVRTDDVAQFGERPVTRGGLSRLAGRDLLRVLRAAADRVFLDGLRRTPAVRDYPTTDLTPLRREEP